METEAAGAAPDAAAGPPPPQPAADAAKKAAAEKKRRVRKHDVPFTVKLVGACVCGCTGTFLHAGTCTCICAFAQAWAKHTLQQLRSL